MARCQGGCGEVASWHRTTKTLAPEHARECRRRIANFRALEKQLKQLVRQAFQDHASRVTPEAVAQIPVLMFRDCWSDASLMRPGYLIAPDL